WGLGGLVSWLCGRGWGLTLLRELVLVLLVSGAVVWLSLGTLHPRLEHGVTLCPVVFNTQFGVGLAIAALLAVVLYVLWRFDFAALKDNATLRGVAQIGIALVLAIGLWQVSLELDRFFAPEAARVSNPAMARQTVLSVCWGLYAIGLIVLGFWQRVAVLRYSGLALLAVTLGKVMLVDLAHVRYVYRVMSLLAVGLLFIGTSIAYAKLESRLRHQASASE
ncbi:MAG: DUF2339 domain-containing protein, partial [Planctomycetota bacterium]